MRVNRRDLLKLTVGGGAGLALGQFINIGEVQAQVKNLKLAGVKEFTTACNFCSCGCGMVCRVKDGKLVNLEGDPDHVINGGVLCPKGASMAATHDSPQRLKTPLRRAPGSDKWQQISWDAGITNRRVSRWTRLPSRIAAALSRSCKRAFVHEPINAC